MRKNPITIGLELAELVVLLVLRKNNLMASKNAAVEVIVPTLANESLLIDSRLPPRNFIRS